MAYASILIHQKITIESQQRAISSHECTICFMSESKIYLSCSVRDHYRKEHIYLYEGF